MKTIKEFINVKKKNEDLRSQVFLLENQINKKIIELKKLGNDILASKNLEEMLKTECEFDFHGQLKMKFIDKMTKETYGIEEIISRVNVCPEDLIDKLIKLKNEDNWIISRMKHYDNKR